MPGRPRRLISAVSSRATRRPEIEVSGIAARGAAAIIPPRKNANPPNEDDA